MRKVAKLPLKFFTSPTYRAINARYGASGALLYVRIYIMCQTATLPDLNDERQLLILASEADMEAEAVAALLADLRRWEPDLLPTPSAPEETEETEISDKSDKSDKSDLSDSSGPSDQSGPSNRLEKPIGWLERPKPRPALTRQQRRKLRRQASVSNNIRKFARKT